MQSEEQFRRAVADLADREPCFAAVLVRHGHPPFWHREPGFATLLLLILEQQVSLASAAATFGRLSARIGPPTPAALLACTDEELREDGFSRQKVRSCRALASAVIEGLRLEALEGMPDDRARGMLVGLPGIGPWTADVYLLSCLRRPDVLPVGDRALQVSAGEVLGLPAALDAPALGELSEAWRPQRSSAARLLWHAYLSRRRRPELSRPVTGGLHRPDGSAPP